MRLARALELSDEELGLAWLAGLLEAEGTFLKPPPSGSSPVVTVAMTDGDVVERVAAAFGVRAQSYQRNPRHRRVHTATLKGTRAVALMRDVRPLLGDRRRAAIDEVLSEFDAPRQKLSFADAEEIRSLYALGETVSALSRAFRVSRPTIRAVLAHRIHTGLLRPWRRISLAKLPRRSGVDLTSVELMWLAGWLEGEGSFLSPPPSDPRRPRIQGKCRDHDVITEVARLFCVSPVRRDMRRNLERGWSPLFGALVRGPRAVMLMEALYPLLGVRRRSQIRRALARS